MKCDVMQGGVLSSPLSLTGSMELYHGEYLLRCGTQTWTVRPRPTMSGYKRNPGGMMMPVSSVCPTTSSSTLGREINWAG